MITIIFSFIILCWSLASSWRPQILGCALSRIFKSCLCVCFRGVRLRRLLRSLRLRSYERSQSVTSKGFFYRPATDSFPLFPSWFPPQPLFAYLSSVMDYRRQTKDALSLMHLRFPCRFCPMVLWSFFFWPWEPLNGYCSYRCPTNSRRMLYFPY